MNQPSGGMLRFSPRSSEAHIGRRRITLSDVESRLLQALIEDRGQVVTRTELMMAAWGLAHPERIPLLETAIDHLRERLGPDVKIETVPGIGYRLP